ncbi:hypothetical protein [Aurantimicrobium minutum]|uniref:hypothetical protein n=1 Tax=Aurantimicrobium minutum TaxID=708131 RepID=UPI0024754810|nr:hypothetical protein [Aurantimicrobium minutum]MDH6536880.1 signal transduction histidine kinase [Aurantimicrobium minutum]
MKALFNRINAAKPFTWQAFVGMGLGLLAFSPSILVKSQGYPPEIWRALLFVSLVILALITATLKSLLMNNRTVGEKPLVAWSLLIGLSILFPVIIRIVADEIFHLGNFQPGFFRYFTTGMIWLLGTLIFAVVVNETRDFRKELGNLRSQLATAHGLQKVEQSTLEELRLELLSNVKTTLEKAFEKLVPKMSQSDASGQLHKLLDDVVRPLASTLSSRDVEFSDGQGADVKKLRVSVKEVANRLTDTNPFEYKWAPVLVALPTLSMKTWVVPFPIALLSFFCSVAFLFVALYVSHYFFSRYLNKSTRRLSLLIMVTTFFAIGLLDTLIAGIIVGLDPSSVGLLIAITEFGALMLLALLRAIPRERQRLLKELDAALSHVEWMNTRRGQLIWVEQQRFARLVHGDIQANILATILDLSLKVKNGQLSQDQITQLQVKCEAALDHPEKRISLTAFLHSLAKLWSASVVISTDISKKVKAQIEADPVAQEAVIEIIREALNNAVKYSHSTSITISIEIQNPTAKENSFPFSLLHIQVVSDVKSASTALSDFGGKPGQGTALFDQLSKKWKLHLDGDSSRLVAYVPIGDHT